MGWQVVISVIGLLFGSGALTSIFVFIGKTEERIKELEKHDTCQKVNLLEQQVNHNHEMIKLSLENLNTKMDLMMHLKKKPSK